MTKNAVGWLTQNAGNVDLHFGPPRLASARHPPRHGQRPALLRVTFRKGTAGQPEGWDDEEGWDEEWGQRIKVPDALRFIPQDKPDLRDVGKVDFRSG